MLNRHLIGLAVVVGCLVPLAGAADLVLDYTFAPPHRVAGQHRRCGVRPYQPAGCAERRTARPAGSARRQRQNTYSLRGRGSRR